MAVLLILAPTPAAGVAPSISSLSPTSGPVGTSVTISGLHFGATQGTSTVTFNGVAATPSSWGNTSIVAPVPSGATTGPVVVTVGGVASNGVTFSVAPSISSLSPTSGPVGTSVTISGATFGATQGTSTVTFNGVAATPSSWGNISIVAPVPSGATTGPVVVTVGGVASNGVTFSVAPSISSLSPTSGPVGTAVTISGATFGATQGTSTVTFNGLAATPTSWSNTSIVAPVPSGATTGPVVVTVGGLASNGVNFTVAPSISSLSPTSGPVGTSVTISGATFGATQGTSTVTFNGLAATPTSWSNTSIVAPVPSGATAGAGPVVVTVGGLASNGVTFTVTPFISGISPSSGGPNAFVAISGSGFGSTTGSSTVTFNGAATQPTSWSATSILAPVPGNASTGPVVVTVNSVASNGVNFTLSTTGTISGSVTRASDGAVVSGAQVEAVQSGSLKASTTTAANGAYSLPNLTPGLYDVEVFANGYLSGKQSAAEVTAGATTTVNIILGAPVIASLAPSSGPVGTTVTITGSNFGAAQGSSTVTFNGTPASPTSWSNASIVAPVPTGATTGPVVVTVAATPSNSVTFTVGTGTITGTVTQASGGAAISGALVEVLQSNVVKTSTTTATNGTYTVSNLSPGSYDLRFSATGFGTTIQAGNNVAANGSITVNAALSSAGTVSGQVTIAGGTTPISGATVTAFQGIDTAGTATTNATGNYSIATLSAGSYTVQAAATGYNPQSQTGVSVTAGGTTTTNFSLAGQHVVSYFYDDLSRLIGASDSPSNTAVYSYDAVGNLLSIANNPTSQVSIIGFSPQSGPVGASVTISGTAFSPTASLNTVLFNGTSATVTSATATQLVATVPTGATTGAIKVTAPAGSATSSTSFTVTASTGAPTITSFTPTIGLSSTAVTITGTNFDPAPANDRVQFNIELATLSSATSTSISTSVPPSGTSGRISVSTSSGKAVSSADFFVPPSPYTAASVGFTGRMTLPGTGTVPINTSNQIGLMLFDGVSGQRLTLAMSGSFTGGCGGLAGTFNVSILNPDGSTLAPASGFCSSSFFDTLKLPATATYTILVTSSGVTGSVTLTLYNVPPDITSTITPGGPSVTVTIATPGQNAYLTFSGAQNQRISLGVSASPTGGCGGLAGTFNVSILNPDGSTLAPASGTCSSEFFDVMTLSTTGTYTIFVNPDNALTGSVTLTLYNVPPDITSTITPGGPSVTVTIATPGQNAYLTFSGTQNQRISLVVSASPDGGCGGFAGTFDIFVRNPNGSTLASTSLCTYTFLDTMTLSATGTYTIFVNPENALTGSVTLTLYNVPADATATIAINGGSTTVSIGTPGQNALVTFSISVSQLATVHVTNNNTLGWVTVTLLDPTGALVTSTDWFSASFDLPQKNLTLVGTYTVKVDPDGATIGSIAISVTSP